MNRITAITFEIEETETIRAAGGRAARCGGCCQDVWMTTPAVIALTRGVSERVIFRMIESRVLDCDENGRLLVCPLCVGNVLVNPERIDGDVPKEIADVANRQITATSRSRSRK